MKKKIYVTPEAEVFTCKSRVNLLAGSTKTEWEINPDGNNGSDIPGGDNHDPDADDTPSRRTDLWESW